MAKILCVLYHDPVDGYPQSYSRDAIPEVKHYPDGQTAPTPKRFDFKPGELLGSVTGGRDRRKFLEGSSHRFVVTSEEGKSSAFESELIDADVVISNRSGPPI